MNTRTRRAMVALKVGKLPPGEELQRAYRDAWPEQDQLEPSGDGTASKIALATAQASFGVELAPAPIPWADLEPAIRAALHWPEAEESLKPHVAHLVVTAQSDEQDAVDLMLSLTRMVAACLLTSEAAGVFWGGSLVNSAEAFLDDAGEMSREYLPLYLWVRFGLMRDKDKTVTLYTLGLDQLDLMEVEFPRSRLDLETLVDRAFNVAHHLLDHGAVLSDRDTIGLTPRERFLVRHVTSVVDPERTVYSLSPARR